MSLPAGPEFDELRAEYRQSLAAKRAALQAQWTQVMRGDAAAIQPLVRALHTLAGSAGTFGFASLSAAARTAEEFLEEKGSALGPPEQAEFERLLQAIRE